MPRLGVERADEHRGRDRAGQRRGHGGRRLGRGRKAAPRGDEHDREGIVRQDRPAERRGHALSGRAVPIYRYKKYTDVRLVFAPEEDIAFFGGDPDNFEYPRYDLDICFFRVYEDGKPAKVPHYLKWNPAGLKEDDLVFVAGNPGKTDRLNTVRHLEFLRDVVLPAALNVLRRREVLLESFSQRSAENARRAKDLLLTYQNSRKARLGGLAGLQDPAVMDRKRAEEKAFLAAAANSPPLAADCATAIKTIDKSLAAWAAIRDDYDLLERGQAFYSELFVIARTLVRLAEETAKPNADRLREYRESNLDSLKQELFSPAPIYDDLQTALLADSLSMYLERKGCADPLAQKVMAGKSPEQRAAELVRGTKLADVAVRRQLADGGIKAIEASEDPMIRLARLVDKPAREVREHLRAAGRGAAALGLRQAGQRPLRDLRHRDLPRRHVHAAAGVRAGEGLSRERRADAGLDDVGRGVSPRQGARRSGAVRPAAKLAGPQEPPESGHAHELRLHGRHYRRQLGQPGGEPQRRTGGDHLRRQPAVAGLGLRLHRGRRPGDRRPRQCDPRSPAKGLRRRAVGR